MKTYFDILMESIGEDASLLEKKSRRRKRLGKRAILPRYFGWIGYPGGGNDSGDGGDGE